MAYTIYVFTENQQVHKNIWKLIISKIGSLWPTDWHKYILYITSEFKPQNYVMLLAVHCFGLWYVMVKTCKAKWLFQKLFKLDLNEFDDGEFTTEICKLFQLVWRLEWWELCTLAPGWKILWSDKLVYKVHWATDFCYRP